MEIEVRQRISEQQRLPGEVAGGAARERDLNRLVFGAVDLRRLEALDEIDGLFDALAELGEVGFVVGEAQRLDAGQACSRVDGVISRGTHLADQREHVGREPRTEQRLRIDLLGFAVGRRLVEHGAKGGEKLHENRHGNLVHRDGHRASSLASMPRFGPRGESLRHRNGRGAAGGRRPLGGAQARLRPIIHSGPFAATDLEPIGHPGPRK